MMPRPPSVPNLISTANATASPSATNPSRDRSAGFCRPLAKIRLRFQPGGGEVVLEHLADHFLEGDLRPPAQPGPRLRGVAPQVGNFRGTEVRLVDLDVVLPVEADQPEGERDELQDRPLDPGGDDVIIGPVLLQHHPHRFDVVFGVAPIALGIEISEPESCGALGEDGGDTTGDLARHEVLAATPRLVIEEDAAAGGHVVGLAVIDRRPVRLDRGHAITAARMKWWLLVLR